MGEILHWEDTRGHYLDRDLGTSILWDLLPHSFSLLNYCLLSKPKMTTCVGNSFEATVGVTCYDFGSDLCTPAKINLSWVSAEKERIIKILGTERNLVVDFCDPDNNYFWKPGGWRDSFRILPDNEPLITELRHWYYSILNDLPSLSNGDEGHKIVAMIEKVQESCRNSRPIDF